MRLQAENLELRSLVGRLHAELLELRLAAASPNEPGPLEGEIPARPLRDELERAAAELKQATIALRQTSEQVADLTQRVQRQDMLIREADHRVANSLQAMISLLHLQVRRQPGSSVAGSVLRPLCTRIEAMAKVHGLLRTGDGSGTADFAVHARELGASLAETFGANGRDRMLVVEVEPVTMAASTVQSLALVVCELVSNAFSHGFAPEGSGTVWIQGRRTADGGFRLTVADDGTGLPDGFQFGRNAGFGHRLVALLADQAGGQVEVANRGGTRVTLTIPACRLG